MKKELLFDTVLSVVGKHKRDCKLLRFVARNHKQDCVRYCAVLFSIVRYLCGIFVVCGIFAVSLRYLCGLWYLCGKLAKTQELLGAPAPLDMPRECEKSALARAP